MTTYAKLGAALAIVCVVGIPCAAAAPADSSITADSSVTIASLADTGSASAHAIAARARGWEPSHLKAEGYTGRFVVVFVLLVGMLAASLWWFKRSGGRLRATGPFRVVGRCDLGPRKSLYTVRVGTRTLVLGVTDASIHTVLELEPEESRTVFPDPPSNALGAGSFGGVLQGLLARMGGG